MTFTNWMSVSEYEPPICKAIEVIYTNSEQEFITTATKIKRYLKTKQFEEYWISNALDNSSKKITNVSYWRYISE